MKNNNFIENLLIQKTKNIMYTEENRDLVSAPVKDKLMLVAVVIAYLLPMAYVWLS